jgi:hypothetical protein
LERVRLALVYALTDCVRVAQREVFVA